MTAKHAGLAQIMSDIIVHLKKAETFMRRSSESMRLNNIGVSERLLQRFSGGQKIILHESFT